MAVKEPPGDFDYLWEDLGETEDDYEYDGDDVWDDGDTGYNGYDIDPHLPAPVPWYRTTAALVALCLIAGGVIAILVSAVLLMSRHSGGPSREVQTTIAPTPSSVAPTTPPMIATVPPSPPPSSTETTHSAPPVAVAPPRQSEPPKPPEITVAPTPITRSPISVRPEPRGPGPTHVTQGPYPGFPHF